MPTYEYECQKCGQVFEYFQNITDPPLKRCIRDGCRGRVKRLIGKGSGIIFKGSGFYTTDYRSPEYHEKAKKEKEAATAASDKKKKSAETSSSASETGNRSGETA